jgi:hypothetical protein
MQLEALASRATSASLLPMLPGPFRRFPVDGRASPAIDMDAAGGTETYRIHTRS